MELPVRGPVSHAVTMVTPALYSEAWEPFDSQWQSRSHDSTGSLSLGGDVPFFSKQSIIQLFSSIIHDFLDFFSHSCMIYILARLI